MKTAREEIDTLGKAHDDWTSILGTRANQITYGIIGLTAVVHKGCGIQSSILPRIILIICIAHLLLILGIAREVASKLKKRHQRLANLDDTQLELEKQLDPRHFPYDQDLNLETPCRLELLNSALPALAAILFAISLWHISACCE